MGNDVDVANIRQEYPLIQVMHDNGGEKKSKDIILFFESMGSMNYYSTSREIWTNGLEESLIKFRSSPLSLCC